MSLKPINLLYLTKRTCIFITSYSFYLAAFLLDEQCILLSMDKSHQLVKILLLPPIIES